MFVDLRRKTVRKHQGPHLRKRMIAQTRLRLFARGLEGFAPLVKRSGYGIAESLTAVVSEQVLLWPRPLSR